LIYLSTGGVAGGVLAASVWAQAPVPPTGPVPPRVVCQEGPVRRAFGHTWRVLQNNFVGYPEEFVEPPLGFYVNENIAVMRAKADPHKFTLYRSDFLAGTNRLSPQGAGRINLMASRLRSSPLPILIEWSPDEPGLAESRRTAVVALLQSVGTPVNPDRVVIGPTVYPGSLGTDAANNYGIMITRDQQAPSIYSVTPNSGASLSSGGTP